MSSAAGQLITSPDGTRIWADDAGNKAGIPVVFIHALACTAFVWNKQFSDAELLRNLYMVRYELRGHGRSDHPLSADAYTSCKYAEDFMTVCRTFDIVKPFVCAWFVSLIGAARRITDVVWVTGVSEVGALAFYCLACSKVFKQLSWLSMLWRPLDQNTSPVLFMLVDPVFLAIFTLKSFTHT